VEVPDGRFVIDLIMVVSPREFFETREHRSVRDQQGPDSGEDLGCESGAFGLLLRSAPGEQLRAIQAAQQVAGVALAPELFLRSLHLLQAAQGLVPPALERADQGVLAINPGAQRRIPRGDRRLGLDELPQRLGETPKADLVLYARLDAVGQAVADLDRRLNGDPARQDIEEAETPSISDRIGSIRDGHWQTRQMPTATQRRDLNISTAGLDALERDLKALIAGDLAKLEEAFAAAAAPWIPGRRVR
jgi:hypothetical protein